MNMREWAFGLCFAVITSGVMLAWNWDSAMQGVAKTGEHQQRVSNGHFVTGKKAVAYWYDDQGLLRSGRLGQYRGGGQWLLIDDVTGTTWRAHESGFWSDWREIPEDVQAKASLARKRWQ